jgi:hypothetical protein
MIIQLSEGAEKGNHVDKIILYSIYGALFFGVPNRGMEVESLLAMSSGQANENMLRMLDKSSSILRDLARSFSAAFPFHDSVIISFYETKLSPQAIKVLSKSVFDYSSLHQYITQIDDEWKMQGPLVVLVDETSAFSGRNWETGHDFVQGLDINHSNLVKFRFEDENYKLVVGFLRKMSEKIRGVISARLESIE